MFYPVQIETAKACATKMSKDELSASEILPRQRYVESCFIHISSVSGNNECVVSRFFAFRELKQEIPENIPL